jgi:hydroxymethylpyrimidine/phosphomethylpyrimidine kinase
MSKIKNPIALTIAGSDSGGGAGLQMDLKIFSARGVYGTSVITAITAQNSVGVSAVRGLPVDLVAAQLQAVLEDLPVSAAKCGMLWSDKVVKAIAHQWRQLKNSPALVLDPVICAKDGTRLLSQRGIATLRGELFPLAALVTPNAIEAGELCGFPVANLASARQAAETIFALGARAVLVKGGHLPGAAADVLFDGKDFREFPVRRVAGTIHGTGCALSAAITAELAKGKSLIAAVTEGHSFIQSLIRHSKILGKGNRLMLPEREPCANSSS